MLGLSRPAVKYRSNEHQDFPEPLAQLRSGPVYDRDDIVAYARERACVFFEQPGVKFLARHGVANREPAVITRKRQGDGQWAEQLDEMYDDPECRHHGELDLGIAGASWSA